MTHRIYPDTAVRGVVRAGWGGEVGAGTPCGARSFRAATTHPVMMAGRAREKSRARGSSVCAANHMTEVCTRGCDPTNKRHIRCGCARCESRGESRGESRCESLGESWTPAAGNRGATSGPLCSLFSIAASLPWTPSWSCITPMSCTHEALVRKLFVTSAARGQRPWVKVHGCLSGSNTSWIRRHHSCSTKCSMPMRHMLRHQGSRR